MGQTAIESLHTEICKSILRVQRNTPSNGCRAELGQFPLLIRIQKRAIKFYQHLKASEPSSYHYKAPQCQEESKEGSPLSQLVHRISANSSGHQDRPYTIRLHQIRTKEKDNYINYWTSATKTQSKLQCYSALNRRYCMADYLSCVTDPRLRKTLAMYRLSSHSLAIETGRHRQDLLPREDQTVPTAHNARWRTELHFLTSCSYTRTLETHIFHKLRNTEGL
ncbi:hypothetical protein D5F01_LYC24519 [Larimichthys crocea]|uniref:Uncharacterized protein n=1 Tax=Larimichthys crocea TaxID=215358 RepID=A0A6G0HE98_LARCR|nr:hypothetical protein D5F01_LYC24519 [Larimichthys crocea]